ncbi:GMC oxidoreductase [Glomus cerebriforme]|uniref:GMC oxidoreductase n=1 Tax=Glomus cerebriforme TaxID=658196 RepID=A0A397SRQ0_9GLOM|nr:GMC oxidoreductase [Glomus cerebriforme]
METLLSTPIKESKIDTEIRDLWLESIRNRDQRQPFKKTNEFYDFIIVGAGTAGCVLARELIYNIPNINILVLEAGPPATQINDIMRSPCAFGLVHRTSETDWGYFMEEQKMPGAIDPTKEVFNKSVAYPRGKVIGGCSTINGMAYMRGQKADYDLWAAQGPEYEIWDFDHCIEAFKAIENNARENPDEEFKKYHGFNGLLHVRDPYDSYDIMKDVIKAAKNLGIPYNNDFNGVKQNGVGAYQCTTKDGHRFSLADGYLNDALKKVETYPPLKPLGLGPPHELGDDVTKFVAVNVKSFAHVLNIIWDEEKKDENIAIGIKYFYDGGVHDAFIAPKGEVIICGGVINSAQILMLSGIGPKNNLEENNIKVRKELPVGCNLLDHPSSCMTAKVPVPSVPQLNYWSNGFDYGIIHKANVEGKIPNKEEFLDERPDIQMFVGTNVYDPNIAARFYPNPTEEKCEVLTIIQFLNIPSSVGYLELCSSNPFIQPKIFPNFYKNPNDLYKIMSALKLSRELLKQPPLSTVWGIKEIELDNGWSSIDKEMSDEDWEQYIRKRFFPGYHSCGTVKMAPETQEGCVNHRLQVYGTKNLRVVDASIFPVVPSGNINAPVAMVAWKASRLIEEDYVNKF